GIFPKFRKGRDPGGKYEALPFIPAAFHLERSVLSRATPSDMETTRVACCGDRFSLSPGCSESSVTTTFSLRIFSTLVACAAIGATIAHAETSNPITLPIIPGALPLRHSGPRRGRMSGVRTFPRVVADRSSFRLIPMPSVNRMKMVGADHVMSDHPACGRAKENVGREMSLREHARQRGRSRPGVNGGLLPWRRILRCDRRGCGPRKDGVA